MSFISDIPFISSVKILPMHDYCLFYDKYLDIDCGIITKRQLRKIAFENRVYFCKFALNFEANLKN